MNAEVYRDHMLDTYVVFFRGKISNSVILRVDNASPHNAAELTDFLMVIEIQRRGLLQYSSTLNSIEQM